MKLSRILRGMILKALLFTAGLSLVVNLPMQSWTGQRFERNHADLLEDVALLFWIGVMALGSLTVFVNLSAKMRANPVVRFLSFVFGPLAVVAWQLSGGASVLEWPNFYIDALLFFGVQVYFYFQFTRRVLPEVR